MSAPVVARRWPVDRWISPTTLNNYRNCALRVRLAHLDRVPEPFVYNVFLRKGRIAHDILRSIAYALRRNAAPVDDETVLRMARLRLPPQNFPSEDARMADARDILRWVNVGRRYLEGIPDPEWLVIEQNLNRPIRLFPKVPAYTLIARPDVIVQRHDIGDRPVFEIIDYKTGKRRPDDTPAVIMRYVARNLLGQRVGNASSADVRFTWLWLDSGEKDVRDLSVDFCTHIWGEITADLERLASEHEWKPNPSFLCNYCPYYRHVCTEQIPYDDVYARM